MITTKNAGAFVGFVLNTAALATVGILLVPAIIHASGEAAWGKVALGQSLGMLGAGIIAYGWAVTGPVRLASLGMNDAIRGYLISLIVRIVLLLPTLLIGGTVLSCMVEGNSAVTLLAFAGACAVGLSSAWFFIGTARPFALLATETAARVVATGTAAGLLLLGLCPLPVALLIQVLGIGVAVTISTGYILRQSGSRLRPGEVLQESRLALARQFKSATIGIGQTLYLALPTVLVGVFAPVILPLFALIDKLNKQLISAISPIVSAAQGWVARSSHEDTTVGRSRQILLLGLAISGLVLLTSLLLGGLVMQFMSAGRMRPNAAEVLAMAFLFASVVLERFAGRVSLAALKGERPMSIASGVGVLIGLGFLVPMSMIWGVIGAVWAISIGFLVMSAIEIAAWLDRRAKSGFGRLAGGSSSLPGTIQDGLPLDRR